MGSISWQSKADNKMEPYAIGADVLSGPTSRATSTELASHSMQVSHEVWGISIMMQ
jgi:hypothetical protein